MAKAPERPEAARQTARGSTLVITNVLKVGALVVFINEALVRSEARLPVLAVCIVFGAGTQVTENMVLAFLDRFFGRTG